MSTRDNQPPELTPDWQVDARPDPFAAGMSRDEPMQIPRNIELGEN